MDVIDHDTLAAVRALWLDDAATLPALFEEPPGSGRLARPKTSPYAQLACQELAREPTGTRGTWHDHREVTIAVRGRKADVVAGLAAANAVFRLGTVLAYPSEARFLRWWPLKQTLEQEPEEKDGTDVWKGTLTADVWSIRAG